MPLTVPPRPIEELDRLFEIFKPYAKEQVLKAKVKIRLNPTNAFEERRLIILHDGKAALYRNHKNLLLINLNNKTIYGIAELFYPLGAYYFRAETDCIISTVMAPNVITALDQNNAWPIMTKVLASNIQHLAYRDHRMIGNSNYVLIRNCIYEYSELPIEIQEKQSLSNFIQDKTALSRSLIMKIISSLKIGGYLEIKKGRLVNLNKLPHEY